MYNTPRTKTSFKYVISLVICVGALYLLDLLTMFDLHRIDVINLLKKIRNNYKLFKPVKAA